MTEPQSLPRIESGPVWTEDFTLTCGAKMNRGHCTNTATIYAEVHKPHCCGHPALNDRGNLEMFVCSYHLGQLEKLADKEIRDAKPRWWIRLFRDDWGRCHTCHGAIQIRSDILQVTRVI